MIFNSAPIFEIRRGKRGRIASLTVGVDGDAPVDLDQQIGNRLAEECARRGVTAESESTSRPKPTSSRAAWT